MSNSADAAKLKQAIEDIAMATGKTVDEVMHMSWSEIEALKQEAEQEMMDTEREVFHLKRQADNAKRNPRRSR